MQIFQLTAEDGTVLEKLKVLTMNEVLDGYADAGSEPADELLCYMPWLYCRYRRVWPFFGFKDNHLYIMNGENRFSDWISYYENFEYFQMTRFLYYLGEGRLMSLTDSIDMINGFFDEALEDYRKNKHKPGND